MILTTLLLSHSQGSQPLSHLLVPTQTSWTSCCHNHNIAQPDISDGKNQQLPLHPVHHQHSPSPAPQLLSNDERHNCPTPAAQPSPSGGNTLKPNADGPTSARDSQSVPHNVLSCPHDPVDSFLLSPSSFCLPIAYKSSWPCTARTGHPPFTPCLTNTTHLLTPLPFRSLAPY